ncbi:MAG: dephospho-CoA kinase [Treponemataceae bacterium]|nr:dephospho-CoA kinase [Treponemataceae bacterium]
MFEEKLKKKIDEKKIAHDIPVFCVAGKIAAGKNFICSILERHGFFCIDADSVIHEIIKERQNEILAEFRDDAQREGIILQNADGSLNRRALGKLIFSKKEFLARQENIVYPAFVENIEKIIAQISFDANSENKKNAPRGIILNAAVLYKTPRLLEKCRAIFFVDAPMFIRFLRVRRRDKIPPSEILKRFFSQRNLLAKYKKFSKSRGIQIVKIKNWGNGIERKICAIVDSAL